MLHTGSEDNDAKHVNLLKGAGQPRLRTREELTHRVPAEQPLQENRKRNIIIGLALSAVVVIIVIAGLAFAGPSFSM